MQSRRCSWEPPCARVAHDLLLFCPGSNGADQAGNSSGWVWEGVGNASVAGPQIQGDHDITTCKDRGHPSSSYIEQHDLRIPGHHCATKRWPCKTFSDHMLPKTLTGGQGTFLLRSNIFSWTEHGSWIAVLCLVQSPCVFLGNLHHIYEHHFDHRKIEIRECWGFINNKYNKYIN